MTDAKWVRPSRKCGDSACPEWQWTDDTVSVRSSLRPTEVATFTAQEWAAFIAAVKAGETE